VSAASRAQWRQWVGASATLAVVVAGLSLGDWQVRRAAEKRTAQQVRDAASASAPMAVPLAILPVADLEGRRVTVTGRMLMDRSIFIDNRSHQGVAGMHVVTPVELAPGGPAILVLRGWVASDPANRSQLPVLRGLSDTVQLEGLAQREIGRGLELPRLFSAERMPDPDQRRWVNLDVDHYAKWSGLTLQPVIVRQPSALEDGLVRAWPKPGDDVVKHEGYATQWYGLSLAAALLWLWATFKSGHAKRQGEGAPQ
jgi:cytochrome oxidase assembly protein ShyY1